MDDPRPRPLRLAGALAWLPTSPPTVLEILLVLLSLVLFFIAPLVYVFGSSWREERRWQRIRKEAGLPPEDPASYFGYDDERPETEDERVVRLLMTDAPPRPRQDPRDDYSFEPDDDIPY